MYTILNNIQVLFFGNCQQEICPACMDIEDDLNKLHQHTQKEKKKDTSLKTSLSGVKPLTSDSFCTMKIIVQASSVTMSISCEY